MLKAPRISFLSTCYKQMLQLEATICYFAIIFCECASSGNVKRILNNSKQHKVHVNKHVSGRPRAHWKTHIYFAFCIRDSTRSGVISV